MLVCDFGHFGVQDVAVLPEGRAVLMVPRLSFLTACSDDSKPYMILKALDESYKNHIGFAIIRSSSEE